jgi:hypothetical protein
MDQEQISKYTTIIEIMNHKTKNEIFYCTYIHLKEKVVREIPLENKVYNRGANLPGLQTHSFSKT